MEKKPIKLGVSGAFGKMGSRIISLAAQDRDFRVVVALERLTHPETGEKIAGVEVTSVLDSIREVDGLVDFSTPEATLEHVAQCVRFKKAIIIGTTGFSEEQKKVIHKASKTVPIVFSPNMSIGVNLLFGLVRQAAAQLPHDYKVNMSEAHHIHKTDAPSGTAKFLAEIIKGEREQQDIPIKSTREGEIIGDHEVIFDSPWDTIKLSHSAKTRDIFAKGALEAIKFAVKKKNGLYSMADVIKRK